jgi:hypothetical protein
MLLPFAHVLADNQVLKGLNIMKSLRQYALIFWPALATTVVTLGGCSGSAPIAVNPAAKTAVQVRIGDAPVDRVLAFELTVTSITLTDTNGTTTNVLSSPTEVEFTHLAGTFEPLTLNSIAQGTYTKATITVSSPDVTYIDPGTGLIMEKHPTLTTPTATVTFPSGGLTVGSSAMSINFDFNLANSLFFDASNNVTVTPVFTSSSVTVASNQQDQDTDDGKVEGVQGAVVSASGSTIVIATEKSGIQLSFSTNASTTYEGVSGLSGIQPGEIVQIDARTQTDGSLIATKIEIEDAQNNSLETDGIVTSLNGHPAVSLKLLVQGEVSSAPSGSKPVLGSEILVTILGSTTYKINADHVDLSNLPFTPVFNGSTIAPAQRVETDVDSPNTMAVLASKVKLQQQSLSGIVSGYTATNGHGSFTLTLSSDSMFAKLTGLTTVTVYQQSATKLKNISSINNGDTLRVRGLLFLDGTQYRMVASHIFK